jgi:MazG-like nucleotide pyrophosphohydrolase family protein
MDKYMNEMNEPPVTGLDMVSWVTISDADVLLGLVGRACRRNSERWFPDLHAANRGHMDVYYTLGLIGEAGEVANKVKKSQRGIGDVTHDEMRSELADVFSYLLLLAGELQIDLVRAWAEKQKVCEERWG